MFSKATCQDALNKIRESNTLLYAIGLGAIVRQAAELRGIKSALAGVDWKRAESEL